MEFPLRHPSTITDVHIPSSYQSMPLSGGLDKVASAAVVPGEPPYAADVLLISEPHSAITRPYGRLTVTTWLTLGSSISIWRDNENDFQFYSEK